MCTPIKFRRQAKLGADGGAARLGRLHGNCQIRLEGCWIWVERCRRSARRSDDYAARVQGLEVMILDDVCAQYLGMSAGLSNARVSTSVSRSCSFNSVDVISQDRGCTSRTTQNTINKCSSQICGEPHQISTPYNNAIRSDKNPAVTLDASVLLPVVKHILDTLLAYLDVFYALINQVLQNSTVAEQHQSV